MAVDISKTFGALLLGGLCASLFSGFVSVQVIVYLKLYPGDRRLIKTVVFAVWALDTSHTAFIWSALWGYLIDNYGSPGTISDVNWSLVMTIPITAILTIIVHLFFAHRIFMLSKRNYWLVVPIMALAFLRFFSAIASTVETFRLGTLSKLVHEMWLFTTGVGLSAFVDVLITLSMFALLRSSRTGAASLNAVIDVLIQYAFETSALTCAGTVLAMICVLAMPNNLIFMALYIVIGKLYANSLLVTLNTRETIRRARLKLMQEYPTPAHALEVSKRGCAEAERLELNAANSGVVFGNHPKVLPLEVHIERSVHYAP